MIYIPYRGFENGKKNKRKEIIYYFLGPHIFNHPLQCTASVCHLSESSMKPAYLLGVIKDSFISGDSIMVLLISLHKKFMDSDLAHLFEDKTNTII